MNRRLLSLVLLLLFLLAVPAHAHKPSDSYLNLQVEGQTFKGQWDIALRDLDYAIGLDGNQDGAITWGELRSRHAEIIAYVLPRLTARQDGVRCVMEATGQAVDNHTDGAYSVLYFTGHCPGAAAGILELSYQLFFDLDPTHRGLLHLTYQNQTQTAIFRPDATTQRMALSAPFSLRPFFNFAREGIGHILAGFDHLLFLLALLLPSVLKYHQGKWEAVPHFRLALLDVLKIVSAFTVAHSITLSFAAVGIIQLPSRWVESAIALSVVLSALNNLRPLFEGRRWMVAFAFGLIHGFGFASVLMDMGLPQGSRVLALVGFNLGVEIGQIAVVSLFLPAAYLMRRSWFYRRCVLAPGSVGVAALASVWLVERIFNAKWLAF
jgi:hypothetical protein